MDIVLECSKIIQLDIDSIKKSKFDSVCIDYDKYRKICDSEIKMSVIKLNNLEIDIDNLKCKYLIVELGKFRYEEYIALGRKAQNNNIQILLENSFINKYGRATRDKFSSSTELESFVNKLNSELNEEVFGVCIDIYACTVCAQDIYEFIISLGNRVKAIRVSDCDSYSNNRILPLSIMATESSSVDWAGIFGALRAIDFDGEIILDFPDSIKTTSALLINAAFEIAYDLGKYIEDRVKLENLLKKYKSIVVFGAGFMFEVYMNSYGNKYPPMFVCDNNKSLWGKSVRGVSIRKPEDLRNISEDTGVFICNSIYYKEIQSQLLEMGIKNIEFFE